MSRRPRTAGSILAIVTLCVCVVAGGAFDGPPPRAQGPQPLKSAALAGRIEAKTFEPIVIEADVEIPDGWSALFDWDVERPAKGREVNNGRTLHVWAPPGTYEIELEVFLAKAEDSKVVFDKKTSVTQLTVTGTVPVDPVKDPEKPAPGVKTAVIVYDKASGPPLAGEAATGQLRKDGESVFFMAAGEGSTPPAFLDLAIERAAEIGLPALVLLDGTSVARVLPMPSTSDAIVAEVRKP